MAPDTSQTVSGRRHHSRVYYSHQNEHYCTLHHEPGEGSGHWGREMNDEARGCIVLVKTSHSWLTNTAPNDLSRNERLMPNCVNSPILNIQNTSTVLTSYVLGCKFRWHSSLFLTVLAHTNFPTYQPQAHKHTNNKSRHVRKVHIVHKAENPRG